MIKLEEVTKTYRGKSFALNNVSCAIDRGEFVFLVGPSGSGKSTFLRLLTHQETPDSGSVFVAGKNVGRLRSWRVPSLRQNVGCIFQDFKLLDKKTVFQNVAFVLEVIGHSKSYIKNQVPTILDLVGLSHKAWDYPPELSGGEQQRVAIARAFANRPLILLADEPTGNLDMENSVGIMKLLQRINETGTTVVMATHDRGIVNTMKLRVMELSQGNLIRDQAQGSYS